MSEEITTYEYEIPTTSNRETTQHGADVEAMNLTEMRAYRANLKNDVERLTAELAAVDAEYRKHVLELAKEMGLDVAPATKRRSRPKPASGPCYRIPGVDPAKRTWSGKGRKPNAIKRHLEEGGTLEALQL